MISRMLKKELPQQRIQPKLIKNLVQIINQASAPSIQILLIKTIWLPSMPIIRLFRLLNQGG